MAKKLKIPFGQNLEAHFQNFGSVIDQDCRTVENFEFFILGSRDENKNSFILKFRFASDLFSNDSSFSHFPTVD